MRWKNRLLKILWMNPEARLRIQRRDLRSGSVFDGLFGLAMVISISTTLSLSASRDCEQLPSRFAFCIPCDNRLVVWGIVAAPLYSSLIAVRLKIFWQLESQDLMTVQALLLSTTYRLWRVINMLNSAWTMLGAIWYFNRIECNEAPDYQRLMFFVNILFWISISKYLIIVLVWITLFCMLRVCPNHPYVVRLIGSMTQPFTDGAHSVEPGVTAAQLAMFPVFKLPQPEGSPDHVALEDRECAICLCPYEDEQPIKRLFCRHHYHSSCIDQWLSTKSTCPLCNSNVLAHLNLPSAPVSADLASPSAASGISSESTAGPSRHSAEEASVVDHRIQFPLHAPASSGHVSSADLAQFFEGQLIVPPAPALPPPSLSSCKSTTGATLEEQQQAYAASLSTSCAVICSTRVLPQVPCSRATHAPSVLAQGKLEAV